MMVLDIRSAVDLVQTCIEIVRQAKQLQKVFIRYVEEPSKKFKKV